MLMFCRSLFVILYFFLLAIVLSVLLRYTNSDYPFGIVELFFFLLVVVLSVLFLMVVVLSVLFLLVVVLSVLFLLVVVVSVLFLLVVVLSVLFLSVIELSSLLRFTASAYAFGIFELFLTSRGSIVVIFTIRTHLEV